MDEESTIIKGLALVLMLTLYPFGYYLLINMKALKERILKDGKIGAGNVLKVDSFVNHQIDVPFMSKLCEEFYRLYKDEGITKILTIEASGIGIACLAAVYFGVAGCI